MVRRILIVLMMNVAIVGFGMSKGMKATRPGRILSLSGVPQNRFVNVLDMEPVFRRYLAVIQVRPRTKEVIRSWMLTGGAPYQLAPAWLNESGRILQIGEPTYAFLGDLNPFPAGADFDLRPDYVFPQVWVRDAMSDSCPFLWVTALNVDCINTNLDRKRVLVLPVQAMSFFVYDGELWMAGRYRDKLFHKVSWKDGAIVESRIPVRLVQRVLEKNKILHRNDASTPELFQPLKTPQEILKLSEVKHPDPALRDLLTRPTSSPVLAASQGNFWFLILRRPFAVLALDPKTGRPVKVKPIHPEMLPEKARYYHDFYLVKAYGRKRDVLAWLLFVKGRSYREIALQQPALAMKFRERWQREHHSDPKPTDIMFTANLHMILKITPDLEEIEAFDLFSFFHDRPGYELGEMPFFAGESMWMTVVPKDPKNHDIRFIQTRLAEIRIP